jgi:uncharacterized membrane protein YdjX (TVP38/TMEM64 family)
MNKTKLAVLAIIAAGIIAAAVLFDLPALLVRGLEYIDSFGLAGALIFIALYITATVAFIPGSILTLGAGVVFGLGWGTVYVSIGSTIGATAAFLLGRSLFRGWISGKIEGSKRFSAIDRAVAEEGWKIVLLTRLSPVFPYNVLNYAYGLTDIGTLPYAFSSWIGMLPGTLLYVYVGSLAGNLAAAAAGPEVSGGTDGPLEMIVRIAGFTATLLVTILVARIARRALSTRIEE